MLDWMQGRDEGRRISNERMEWLQWSIEGYGLLGWIDLYGWIELMQMDRVDVYVNEMGCEPSGRVMHIYLKLGFHL